MSRMQFVREHYLHVAGKKKMVIAAIILMTALSRDVDIATL
jgi:hypothetical protein